MKKIINALILFSCSGSFALAGVIGHWTFDDQFEDSSGNGYHGTVEGAPLQFIEGKQGRAVEFEGASSVGCGNVPLGTTGQITVAFWAKPTKPERSWGGIVQKQNRDYSERSFWIGAHRHGIMWAYFSPSIAKGRPVIAKKTVTSGEWLHVAMTFDGVYQRTYINGKLFVTGDKKEAPFVDGGDIFRFGRVENTKGGHYWGGLDDVWVFDEALSEERIAKIMAGDESTAPAENHEKEETSSVLSSAQRPADASATETNRKGAIKSNQGTALEGVKIVVLKADAETTTNSEGVFQLPSNLGEEKHIELICKKDGYLNTHRSLSTLDEKDVSITMIPSVGSVTDMDGNIYQTVIIGDQEWMAQNLRTTTLTDGTPIQQVTDDELWLANEPHYCYLHNNPDYAERFGALYNWYVIQTGKLAPTGWHVATAEDWDRLEKHLISSRHNFDQSDQGNLLAKSLCTQTADWPSNFPAGTPGNEFRSNNSSGFSAFPSGARGGSEGNFVHLNEDAYWWTSTEKGGKAVRRNIFGSKALLKLATSNKTAGMSIRLVRD